MKKLRNTQSKDLTKVWNKLFKPTCFGKEAIPYPGCALKCKFGRECVHEKFIEIDKLGMFVTGIEEGK